MDWHWLTVLEHFADYHRVGSTWAVYMCPNGQIWCKNVDLCPNYGPKTKFKMTAAAILNLLPVAFLTYSRFFTVDLNHHPKFRANISICGWLTVIFQNSRWRPSAILDFRKPDFCPMVGLGLLIFHHDAKFGAKMLIGAQIRAQNRNSKWRPPPSWIYFRLQFLTYSRLSTVDLNHHTKFRANISIGGWLMVTFQISRWRPSAILDFWKCDFWPIGGLGLLIFHHDTKFGAKTLIHAQVMAKKRNSKMAAAAVLNLLPVTIFDIQPHFLLSSSTTTPNLVPISQSAADLW